LAVPESVLAVPVVSTKQYYQEQGMKSCLGTKFKMAQWSWYPAVTGKCV